MRSKPKLGRGAAAYSCPADLHVTRHPQLRRDGGGEIERAALAHADRRRLGVASLISLALGLREAVVVVIAIPVTLALTLFVFYLYGYTLNRITLFALIFSIGILVDDAIVVVENIVRHCAHAGEQGGRLVAVAVEAVDEVGNPTILATLHRDRRDPADGVRRRADGAVHAADSRSARRAAMLFSLVVAFIVTPWAAVRLLRTGGGARADDARGRASTRALPPRDGPRFIAAAALRWRFLGGVVAAAARRRSRSCRSSSSR